MKIGDLASRAELAAATAEKSGPFARAANEDSPMGGTLYRLMARRPSGRIPAAAALASLLCIGAEAAYVWGLYGIPDPAALSRLELGLAAAALLVPLLLIWLMAYVLWRGQEMRLMAEALAHTAIRLADPQDFTAGEVANLAQAIQTEIGAMHKGLETALEKTANLNALITAELEDIERGTGRAEMRARTMGELLGRHRISLEEVAHALGSETDVIARALREQVDAVRGIAGQAEQNLQAASSRLIEHTQVLAHVSEAARVGADTTSTTLDRQTSRLEVVATNALSKADALNARYENQRSLIAEAATRLEAEHNRLEAVFEAHRDGMQDVNGTLGARTEEIARTAGEVTASLNAAFEAAEARVKRFRDNISTDVVNAASEIEQVSLSVSRSAGAAARAIDSTVDGLKNATLALNEDVTRLTISLSSDISSRVQDLRVLMNTSASDTNTVAEQFNGVMTRLGSIAKEAGHTLQKATSDLAAHMGTLPAEATASAQALRDVLEEHVSALATIAEIVVNHARTLDRSTPRNDPRSEQRASQPVFTPPPFPRNETTRRWAIPDLLAAVGRGEETLRQENETGEISERDFQRSSLHVIETLQALAIDLDRALEQSPPPELWRRYQAGERNVFARRLYSIAGRQLYDRITAKYRSDTEFREHADHFIGLFERLIASSAERDRDNILVETYLTSDTGKVYLILAQATGKLG